MVGDVSCKETGEVRRRDSTLIRPLVAYVELRVSVAASECQIMFAESPNSIRGRHPTVLKKSRIWPLRAALWPQAQGLVEETIRILATDVIVAKRIHNLDAGKVRRSKGIDAGL